MRYLFVLLCAGLLLPGVGFAQSYEADKLEQEGLERLLFDEIPVISSAGFFNMKATKAPGTSMVLNSDYIRSSSARTISELIEQNVPGVSVNRHIYGGTIDAVRGMSANRTVALLDGQNIGSNIYDFNHESLDDLPLLGDIDKLEYIKGPGAITFGSGAIGGFMNIIPKNGITGKGFFAEVEHGFTEEEYKVESGYGNSFGSHKDFFIYGGIVTAHGVKADKNTWDNPIEKHPTYTSYTGQYANWQHGILAKGFAYPSYKVSANANYEDFHLKILMENSSQYFNGIVDNGANQERGYHGVTNLNILPRYDLHFTDTDELDLLFSVQLMQEGMQIVPKNSPSTSGDSRIQGTQKRWEVKPVFKTTRFARNSLAVGMSFSSQDTKAGDSLFHGGEPISMNTGASTDSSQVGVCDLKWQQYGLFAEDVIEFTDKLTGSIGVRWDKVHYLSGASAFRENGMGFLDPPFFSVWGPLPNGTWASSYDVADAQNFSQRYALAYEFSQDTAVKVSYQEGFIYPSAGAYVGLAYYSHEQELAGYGPLSSLKPEKMNSIEGTLHHNFEDARVMFDLTGYFNTYDSLIVWYTPSASSSAAASAVQYYPRYNFWEGYMTNIEGTFRSVGFELAATWKPVDSSTIIASYGYSQPSRYGKTVYGNYKIVTSNRQQWTAFPQHLVKLNIVNKFFDGRLTTHVNMFLSSGYPGTRKSNYYVDPIYKHSRFVTNVAAVYSITENLSAKLTIDNLFGSKVPQLATTDYSPYSGAAGQDKRYYYLSLRYQF